jgi:hypothetical protein
MSVEERSMGVDDVAGHLGVENVFPRKLIQINQNQK